MVNKLSKFQVDESLASRLLSSKWVSSTSTDVKTDYGKNEDGKHTTPKSSVRVVVHAKTRIRDKDDFNNVCLSVLSDPIFEGKDIKFNKTFYDSCIYLTYYGDGGNHIDIILGHDYYISGRDKAKLAKLYSDISGCDMKRESEPMGVESWSCGVKAE